MKRRLPEVFKDFNIKLWDGREICFSEQPKFILEIRRKRVLWKLLFTPDFFTLGRAYIEGDYEINGDIFAAIGFADRLSDLKLMRLEKAKLLKELWKKIGSRD